MCHVKRVEKTQDFPFQCTELSFEVQNISLQIEMRGDERDLWAFLSWRKKDTAKRWWNIQRHEIFSKPARWVR